MGIFRGYIRKNDSAEVPLNSRPTDKFGPTRPKKFGLIGAQPLTVTFSNDYLKEENSTPPHSSFQVVAHFT